MHSLFAADGDRSAESERARLRGLLDRGLGHGRGIPANQEAPDVATGGWVPDPPPSSTGGDRAWAGAPGGRHRGGGGPVGVLHGAVEGALDRVPVPLRALAVAPRAALTAALLAGAVTVLLVACAAGGSSLPGSSLPVPARAEEGPASWTAAASAAPVSSQPTVLPAAASPAELLVHVVGAVNQPGVVRVPAGARVSDALALAGGATPDADLLAVNLARAVVDGEQVVVPRPGEVVAPAPPPTPPPAAAPGGSPGTAGGMPGAASGVPARVDLNTADVAALDTLPGIGPVLAGRIVDRRTARGAFTAVEELAEVPGIGERVLEQLRPLVDVG